MAQQRRSRANRPAVAESVRYKLAVDRGVDVIIQFELTVFDEEDNEYLYSLRDFDEDPATLKAVLARISETWPSKNKLKFEYTILPSGLRAITKIL